MDYKSKLTALTAYEKERLEKEDLDREKFSKQQEEAFAPLTDAIRELSSSVDSEIASFTIHSRFAKVHVGQRPSSFTQYEISPLYEGSFNERRHVPGFKVITRTTYPNSPDGEKTFESSDTFQSIEDVLEELMKPIAKLMATRQRQQALAP